MRLTKIVLIFFCLLPVCLLSEHQWSIFGFLILKKWSSFGAHQARAVIIHAWSIGGVLATAMWHVALSRESYAPSLGSFFFLALIGSPSASSAPAATAELLSPHSTAEWCKHAWCVLASKLHITCRYCVRSLYTGACTLELYSVGNNAMPHCSDGYSVLSFFSPLQKTGYRKACDAEKVVANV